MQLSKRKVEWSGVELIDMGDKQSVVTGYYPAGFFVLRTPLLPMTDFVSWSSGLSSAKLITVGNDQPEWEAAWQTDVQILRNRLCQLTQNADTCEALAIASHSLQKGIAYWKQAPESKKGVQTERSLVRYFARMTGRSTPFGLFSGCTLGAVLSDVPGGAVLSLEPRVHYRSVARLDFNYLFSLTAKLRKEPMVTNALRYWPNPTLYRSTGSWIYIETRDAGGEWTNHLVSVARHRVLDAIIDVGVEGYTPSQFVDFVLGRDGNVSRLEALEYIQELITNQVLLSCLYPRVTGDAMEDLISQLGDLESMMPAVNVLSFVNNTVKRLNEYPVGKRIPLLRQLSQRLNTLEITPEIPQLFQLDLMKPARCATLGAPVIDELATAVDVLCRLSSRSGESDVLRSFRKRFVARYERAAVPLLEALDPEIGVGLESDLGPKSSLLKGIPELPFRREPGGSAFSQLSESMLMRQLFDSSNKGLKVLRLRASEIIDSSTPNWRLPNSFSVSATLIAQDVACMQSGNFEIRLNGIWGPNGASAFGRFCHIDATLFDNVQQYVKEQEANQPDVIHAEIVYLPEGRLGNVLSRPVLREYEIICLGRSGAPPERQIPASDLLVAVDRDIFRLYSRRLGREVIPWLTNSHAYMNPKLPAVYRFLCLLQGQLYEPGPAFSWGALESLHYLPRVAVGKTILSAARWRLSAKDIEDVSSACKFQNFLAAQEMRQSRGLPRWITLEQGDQSLPIDLDNPLSVDAGLHVMKRGGQAVLREMYPPPDKLCVTSEEGRFCHELHIPFIRRSAERPNQLPAAFSLYDVAAQTRSLPLGSTWVYIKLYGGSRSLDETLKELGKSLLPDIRHSKMVRRWFFIRYRDPRPHLRLRFNGDPERLLHELVPKIAAFFNSLVRNGLLSEIQYCTYEREVERYGGAEGMSAAEDIFHADSEAVIRILGALDEQDSSDTRWQVALLGVDRLLSDFGNDLIAKHRVTRLLRASDQQRRVIADKFRIKHKELETLLDGVPGVKFAMAIDAFCDRSARIINAVNILRKLDGSHKLTTKIEDLLQIHLHLHINRLLTALPKEHEVVLYDYLFRIYQSRLARIQNR